MTGSLDDELSKDEIQRTGLYTNKHGYRYILRYIRILFGSQEVNVFKVSEVSQSITFLISELITKL